MARSCWVILGVDCPAPMVGAIDVSEARVGCVTAPDEFELAIRVMSNKGDHLIKVISQSHDWVPGKFSRA